MNSRINSIKHDTVRIYLADPIHNYIKSRDNWMIPLNALYIASYTKMNFGDQVDIKIFKFPDLILQEIEKNRHPSYSS